MSILTIKIDVENKIFEYIEENIQYNYFDIEFILTNNSPVLGINFGYDAFCNDEKIASREFNEDFAYREFERQGYYTTSRIENNILSTIVIKPWVSLSNLVFTDEYILNLPVPEKPFLSWVMGPNGWEPPVPVPSEDFTYRWDEDSIKWVIVEWDEDNKIWMDLE